MRLRARVRQVSGTNRHDAVAYLDFGTSDRQEAETPPPHSLEIRRTNEGVFLYRMDEAGIRIGDSWHLSVDEAKARARFDFGVQDDDWEVVEG